MLALLRKILAVSILGVMALIGAACHEVSGNDAEATVWVDAFEWGEPGQFPPQWQARNESAKTIYQLARDEDGARYLAARANNISETIGLRKSVNLVEFPYLVWAWRAHELPPGGNEGVKAFCDQAAAVYVGINDSLLRPQSIKYSWSTTLEIGAHTQSPFNIMGRTDVIVLQSGAARKGVWVWEKRNVLADYKRLYGKEDVPELLITGVFLQTDSDNTGTFASADYDSIHFTRE